MTAGMGGVCVFIWTRQHKTILISVVLVGYDYILTIQRESQLFWKRRVNAASILFFTNRYLALLYYVGLAYYRCLALPFPVSRATRLVNFFHSLIVACRGRYTRYVVKHQMLTLNQVSDARLH